MPPQALCEWETVVSSHMPHLSKPQVKVLALYSFGMAMTRSCGLTGIACFLSGLLGKKAKETLAEGSLAMQRSLLEARSCPQQAKASSPRHDVKFPQPPLGYAF